MVTESKDYMEELQKQFPEWAKSELKEVVDYGLKIFDFANSNGADVTLHKRGADKIIIHCGPLGYDSLKHYRRFVLKHGLKERVLWKLKRKTHDGYYYIGLTQAQHEKILKQKGKEKVFTKVLPVRIINEIYHDKVKKHIWRIKYPTNCGFKFYADKLTTTSAEYIGENKYAKYHQCFLGGNHNGSTSADDKEHNAD